MRGLKMSYCKECGVFWYYEGEHNHFDVYEVKCDDDDEDDWIEIKGMDHEDVAERYGVRYNEDGDYSLMDNEITVEVRKQGEKKIKKFVVGAEADIRYNTSEIEDL